jgi:hypothetical protein
MWYEGLEYGRNSSQNIFFYGTLNEHITRSGEVLLLLLLLLRPHPLTSSCVFVSSPPELL